MVNSNLDKILINVRENINGLFDELLRVKKEVNQLTVVNKNLQTTVDNRDADLSVLRKQTEEFISEIENSTAERDALKLETEKLSYSNKEFESVLEHHQKELIALRKENKYLRSAVESDAQVIRGKQSEVYQLQALLKDTHQSYGQQIQVLRGQVADTSMLDAQNKEYQKLLSSYQFSVKAFELKQAEILRLQEFISEVSTKAIIQKKLEEKVQLKRAKLTDWRTQSFKNQIKRAEGEVDQLSKLLVAKMNEVYALQDLVKENQKDFSEELIAFRDDLLKYSLAAQDHTEQGVELEKTYQDQRFLHSSLKAKQAEVYRLQDFIAEQAKETAAKNQDVLKKDAFTQWQLLMSNDLKDKWEKEASLLTASLKAKMNELYQLQSLNRENWTTAVNLHHQNKVQQIYIDELEYRQLELEEEAETKNPLQGIPVHLYLAKQAEVERLQVLCHENWKESAENSNEKQALVEQLIQLKYEVKLLETDSVNNTEVSKVTSALYIAKQKEVYALQALVESNRLEADANLTETKEKITKLKAKNIDVTEKLSETKKSLALVDTLLSGKQAEVYQLQELVNSNFKTFCEEKTNTISSKVVEEKEAANHSQQILLNELITDKKQLELHLKGKLQEVQDLQYLIGQKGKQENEQNTGFDSEDEELEFIQLELDELREKLEDRIEENKMLWELAQEAKLKISQTKPFSENGKSLNEENQDVNGFVSKLALSQEAANLVTNLQESTKTPLLVENESVNDFQYRSNFTRIVESLGGEDGDPKKLTEAIDNYIQQIDHCIKYIDRLI